MNPNCPHSSRAEGVDPQPHSTVKEGKPLIIDGVVQVMDFCVADILLEAPSLGP